MVLPAWTKDVQQLMLLCDIDPLCHGFNSNGLCALRPIYCSCISVISNSLKVNLEQRVASPGCDLYVKA